MKIYNNTILAATISLILSGCGGAAGSKASDNDPALAGSGTAPEVSGDLMVTFSENDTGYPSPDPTRTSENYTWVDLMEGVSDPDDFDIVRIKSINQVFAGPECTNDVIALSYPEECGVIPENATPEELAAIVAQREAYVDGLPEYTTEKYGFELRGDRVKVTPTEFIPVLSNGEYAEVKYEVTYSDGTNDVVRNVSIRVDGDGSAPIAGNTIVAYPTERTASAEYDLLAGAVDPDNAQLEGIEEALGPILFAELYTGEAQPEVVTVANFTPVGDYLDGSYAFNEETGVLTVTPTVYADSLAGQAEQVLEFTYDLTDGTNLVPLVAQIRIQGLYEQNPPAAVDGIFFGNMAETDDITSFDLRTGVEDPEGDEFEISEIVAGDDVPAYSWSINGPELVLDPHAFASHVASGESKVFNFQVKYIDQSVDTLVSYDYRDVQITVNGVETNLLAAAGVNWNFEDPAKVGEIPFGSSDFHYTLGWVGSGPTSINAAGAYDGDYGLSFTGNSVVTIPNNYFPDFEADKVYFLNVMMKNTSDWAPFFTLSSDRWGVGTRPDSAVVANEWAEISLPFNTREGGRFASNVGTNTGALEVFDGLHNLGDNGDPIMDNFQLYTHNANEVRDVVANEGGLFEDDTAAVTWTGGGTATIDAAAALAGNFGLMVDTTGATGDVVVKLPMKVGAIQTGGRYVIEYDIQNPTAAANSTFTAEFETAGGKITRTGTTLWGAGANHVIDFLNEDTGSTAAVDWQNQTDVTVNIVLPVANTTYYIDNVRVYVAP